MTRRNAAFAIVLVGGLAACRSNANPPAETASQSPASTVAPAPGVNVPADGMAYAPPSTAGAAPVAPAATPGYTYEPEVAPSAPRTASRPAPAPAKARPARRAPAAAPSRPADDERVVEPLEPELVEASRAADETAAEESRVRERLVLPEGTELRLVIEETLSSATSQEGDRVTARVERALTPDGRVALPGGTVLRGTVYRADSAGRVKGRSRLGVDFNRIVVRGVEHAIDTTALDVQGPDNRGRDAAIVGGGTAGGAILGGILGGGKGARKGAVIGAVGGAGAILATKGKEVELPSGSRWSVRVKDSVRLD
jgi:hypothetical protein